MYVTKEAPTIKARGVEQIEKVGLIAMRGADTQVQALRVGGLTNSITPSLRYLQLQTAQLGMISQMQGNLPWQCCVF